MHFTSTVVVGVVAAAFLCSALPATTYPIQMPPSTGNPQTKWEPAYLTDAPSLATIPEVKDKDYPWTRYLVTDGVKTNEVVAMDAKRQIWPVVYNYETEEKMLNTSHGLEAMQKTRLGWEANITWEVSAVRGKAE
jgi:hypothetical protein